MNDYLKANRASWDQRTGVHIKSEMYDQAGFMQGNTSLKPIELAGLGDVSGKSMLHLQCHFGQDTLSWARLGAQVTGVDFSPAALKVARSMNDELGMDVKFVEANVLELDQHLDGQFDIVFTSYGVLGWLPELKSWARVIDHFLKPGGTFYIVEFHSTLYLFDWEKKELAYDYFNRGNPYKEEVSGTYVDRDAPIKATEYYWSHSLHETINPLLDKGLHMEIFREYPYSPYNCFENMKETAPGQFVYDCGYSLPHLFELKMTK